MKCESCGWEGNPNLEETGPHTKASCRSCGKYIKMVSKKELEEIISGAVPEMQPAFKIKRMDGPRGCSACYTEDPNGWCIKNDVVMIETVFVKMYLCQHHRQVLIALLKNY